jgi:hypothetical protein
MVAPGFCSMDRSQVKPVRGVGTTLYLLPSRVGEVTQTLAPLNRLRRFGLEME